jgi:hypothetical protein
MKEYIDGYQHYLKTSSLDKVDLLPEHAKEFWKWFQENAKLFNNDDIKRNLLSPFIILKGGVCFKNSYIVSKTTSGKIFYYEGFAYREMDYSYLRHAFNVNKDGEVLDYSLNKPWKRDKNQYYQIYIGVQIPISFAKMVYNEKKGKNSQYSLLVSYYLHGLGFDRYLEYTSAS